MNFFLVSKMKYYVDSQKQGGLLKEIDVRQLPLLAVAALLTEPVMRYKLGY